MNDLAIWQGIFEEHKDAVARELGYSVDVSLLFIQPDSVPEDAQDAVQAFEAAILARAMEYKQYQIDLLTRELARLALIETARHIEWATYKGTYNGLGKVILKTLESEDDSSQVRAFRSFARNYLSVVEQAGVDINDVVEVMGRDPKVLENMTRAISRQAHNEIGKDAADANIREIVQDSTMLSAAAIIQKWVNGRVQVPFDEIQTGGLRLLTAVCSDEEQYHAVSSRVKDIRVTCGNIEPILVEYMKGKK